MVEKDISFQNGDEIEVVFEREKWIAGGRKKETVEVSERGTVTATPSQKFSSDGFDLDYRLGENKAVKSINFDTEIVAQLMYDAGGDRDWDEWDLISVKRL